MRQNHLNNYTRWEPVPQNKTHWKKGIPAIVKRNMCLAETKLVHITIETSGCSKYDGIGTATRPLYILKKTSRVWRHNGDIRESASPGYSASQKRYHMGSNCLRHTVQPFSRPFLLNKCFFLCVKATQLEVKQGFL